MYQPLADWIRPTALDDVVGQEHILGPGAVLRTQDVRTVFVTDQVLVVGGQQVQRDAGGLRRTAGFVHE